VVALLGFAYQAQLQGRGAGDTAASLAGVLFGTEHGHDD
jgi:hypothetical protein